MTAHGSSAVANSAADWKRSAAVFAIIFATKSLKADGTSGRVAAARGGRNRLVGDELLGHLVAGERHLPGEEKVTGRAERVHVRPGVHGRAIDRLFGGRRKSAVPRSLTPWPRVSSLSSSCERTRPRSRILTVPDWSTIMFAGLMSR